MGEGPGPERPGRPGAESVAGPSGRRGPEVGQGRVRQAPRRPHPGPLNNLPADREAFPLALVVIEKRSGNGINLRGRRPMPGKSISAIAAGAALLFAAGLYHVKHRSGASGPGTDPVSASAYGRDIQPILARHCYSCHGNKKTKAKLNLERFPDEASVLKARKTWKRIYDQINSREMPPEEKPRIPGPDLEKLTAWIEAALDRTDPAAPRDPGRVVMRRLNRVEYRNTIRDLVGIDFNPNAEDFPSDDVGYGFDNIGDVLSLPPLLMEKYLAAAEKILDRAIVSEDRHRPKAR